MLTAVAKTCIPQLRERYATSPGRYLSRRSLGGFVLPFNLDAYPVVDMRFYKRAASLGIPRALVSRIRTNTKLLEEAIRNTERDTGIKYHPATVLPHALYDIDHRLVVDAHVTVAKKGVILILEVQFGAPTVAFGDRDRFLGTAAHEFLHVAKLTIDMKQHKITYGTLEGMSLGEVPDEVKAKGLRARDEYLSVKGEDWLTGETLAAWIISEKEAYEHDTNWNRLVNREWIGKGYPTQEYVRGRAVRPGPGRLTLSNGIIEKATQLGLMD